MKPVYKIGDKVLVKMYGDTYISEILSFKNGKVEITYSGCYDTVDYDQIIAKLDEDYQIQT